jgi:uncharacterized membrane protein
MRGEQEWYRAPAVVGAAVLLLVVVVVELVLGRASGPPADTTLFLGRFHPLVVHLPIGVLVLVALAEAATFSPKLRERIDPALGLALPVLVLVTAAAFVLGHFLGRAGGYAPSALTLHRRLEFLAAVGTCVTAALFARYAALGTQTGRGVYRASLGLTLLLLSIGAHFGGTVTHGDSYLTEYAPGPLKGLLGDARKSSKPQGASSAPAAPPAEPLVYGDVVAPILEKYCIECHGPKKQKGKLRVDSIEAMLRGGEEGPAFVAGSSPSSELVRRVKLPADDDDRMPPEGKPGPTPEELAVVAFWIDRGGSPALEVRDTLAPLGGRKVLEAALAKAPAVPGAVSSAIPSEASPRNVAATDAANTENGGVTAPKVNDDSGERNAEPKAPETAPSAATEPAETGRAAAVSSPAPSGRAVLAERCEKCHGAGKKKGGLRVDSLESLLAGGENGPGVVPGEPERSEIVRRMRLPLASEDHMPPKKEPQPSDVEIAALAAWVRGLAKSAASGSGGPSANASKSETDEAAVTDVASETKSASEPAPSAGPRGSSASAEGAESEPSSEAPADAALLARVPARLALYSDAVAPLLAKRCGKCHSGAKPAARLRVDEYAALVEGGLSGPGIVPGKPDESLVVRRISLPASDDDHMPPADEPAMTADEIALVRFWVERGAASDLELPAKELPASPLRAAAVYGPKAGESPSLRADGGCAACAIGSASVPGRALAAASVLVAALVVRRARRRAGAAPG